MLGSLDWCKWVWKSFFTGNHTQYKGEEEILVVMIEAIADDWFSVWYMLLGMAGCKNDINVLASSQLDRKIAHRAYTRSEEYKVNGAKRNSPYWLMDGIYMKGPLFVQRS